MNDKITTVQDLKNKIRDFSIERNWDVNDINKAKDYSVALSVEASELVEIFQWTHSNDVEKRVREPETFIHIKEEVADIFWYLLRVCDSCDIDLTDAINDKAIKNAKKYPPAEKV